MASISGTIVNRPGQLIADYAKYSATELENLDPRILEGPITYLLRLEGEGFCGLKIWRRQLFSELGPHHDRRLLDKVQAAVVTWQSHVWDGRLRECDKPLPELPFLKANLLTLKSLQGPLKEGESPSERLIKFACLRLEIFDRPHVTLLSTFEPDTALWLLPKTNKPALSDAIARWTERLEFITKTLDSLSSEKKGEGPFDTLILEGLLAEQRSYKDLITFALENHPHRKLVSRHMLSQHPGIDGIFSKHRKTISTKALVKPPTSPKLSLKESSVIPEHILKVASETPDAVPEYPIRRRTSRQPPSCSTRFCNALSQIICCIVCCKKTPAKYRVSPEHSTPHSLSGMADPPESRIITKVPTGHRAVWQETPSSPTLVQSGLEGETPVRPF